MCSIALICAEVVSRDQEHRFTARITLQVQVDLSETPLFHPHNVKVVEHLDDLGMTISEHGEITDVVPGSPAHAAGVVQDRSIIQVLESLLLNIM